MNREERIEQLEKELAELKAMGNSLKPEIGDDYFSLNNSGCVLTYKWSKDDVDNEWYSQGNVFKTEAEAIRERDRRALVQRMREYAGGFKPDWGDANQAKWYIIFCHAKKRLEKAWRFDVDLSLTGGVYFKSEEAAQRCLDVMGAELKAWYENV